MITRVLDTSVALAWYMPESFSPSARIWQQRFQKGEVNFIVPALHSLEFANVLRTYTRRGELDGTLARDIYRTHMSAPLTWVEHPRDNILDVAFTYETTTYDACFISLALTNKVPVLTAEKTTTPWVVKLGKLAEVIR
jgi:predicted nucleic acid-binding protein